MRFDPCSWFLLVFALAPNVASALPEVDGGAPASPSEPTLSVESPKAALDWRIEPRYEAGWDAYDEATARYDRGYVHPRFVDVTFDTCASRGGMSDIEEIRVDIRAAADAPVSSRLFMTAAECVRKTSLNIAPHVADVHVRNVQGETASAQFRLDIRDWLIVSLGDSLSSGEGVPDRDADVRSFGLPVSVLPTNALSVPPNCLEIDDGNFDINEARLIYHIALENGLQWKLALDRPADWADRRCHRSKLSGPALAAKAIEDNDPHSSVTFVSLACSGASLKEGVLGRYAGQEVDSDNSPEIESQIDALRALLGERPADAVIVSAGINDIGFSDIVLSAAEKPPDSSLGAMRRRFDAGFAQLASRFEEAAERLNLGMAAREVYAILYPETPFSGAGGEPDSCGLFESRAFDRLGVQEREIRLIHGLGDRLNAKIAEMGRRLGWNAVDARDLFDRAGYCVPPPQRRLSRLKESCRTIGRRDGILHPNEPGHEMLAERIAGAIVLGPTPKPSHEVTVNVRSVTLTDPAPLPGDPEIPLFLELDRGAGVEVVHRQANLRRNTATSLPSELGRFFFRVWRAPTLPRLPTGADVTISGQLPAHDVDDPEPGQGGPGAPPLPPRRFSTSIALRPANDFAATAGPATRTLEFANGGSITINYEITTKRLVGVGGVPPQDPVVPPIQ